MYIYTTLQSPLRVFTTKPAKQNGLLIRKQEKQLRPFTSSSQYGDKISMALLVTRKILQSQEILILFHANKVNLVHVDLWLSLSLLHNSSSPNVSVRHKYKTTMIADIQINCT